LTSESEGCFINLSQIFLSKGKDAVERLKARVGTSEFKNGSGRLAARKNRTTTMYVSMRMMMRRVQLVSQALSSSTRVLRTLRAEISCSKCSTVDMSVILYQVKNFYSCCLPAGLF